MAELLEEQGYTQKYAIKNADIYILNSCTVTLHSDTQALYFIKNAKKQNPKVKIVLTGCMAQTIKDPTSVDADLILGNDEKLDIANYISKINIVDAQEPSRVFFVKDIFNVKDFKYRILNNPKNTRPNIKIQEGCNNRCSYCIIPYARGNSRSNSVKNIVEQINLLASFGFKEVVLTGIHIGQWGFEFNSNLLNLLKEIEKTNILRYRLGSLYANEITDEMVEFLSSSKKFCPHFHLSLQSLTDSTLQNMNRHYTKASALLLIEKLKNSFHLPFIGCDIITGFPKESDNDFTETFEALKNSCVSYIHSFPYSERDGTQAASMSGAILPHIRHDRTKKLIELSSLLHKDFLEKNKNMCAEILYQKKSCKTGLYSGVTRNYIKVFKMSETDLRNTIEISSLSEFDSLY